MPLKVPSRNLTRRSLLRLLVAGAAARIPTARAGTDIAAVPSLGAIAARSDRLFGTAFDIEMFESEDVVELYRHHAGILTTDHSLKFGSIRPQEDVADFTAADRLVDFAAAARIPVRGHNLIWNDYNPAWVGKLSAARRVYWLERHIDETVGRYAGRMHSWDVVNEPFWPGHGKPGGFRDGPWYAAMGKDYIKRSFLRAGRADPQARLVLNEAGAEWASYFGPTDSNRAGILALIDDVRDAGARLDIVGLECHWLTAARFDPTLLGDFLGRLAEKAVDVYITELDVDDKLFPDPIGPRDELVARRYSDFLSVALRAPAVKAVITWELADPQSWLVRGAPTVSGATRRPRPLPFDEDLRPKAAYDAIASALQKKGPSAPE